VTAEGCGWIPSTGLPEILGASSGTGNPPPLMPDIWLAAITAAMQGACRSQHNYPAGALAGGARWTPAGLALKPPPYEVASVLGAAGDQLVSLMCARIRALLAEFTLVMVTVRGGRYDGSPSHPAGDFGSLAARP
jgi:hypothetical protein